MAAVKVLLVLIASMPERAPESASLVATAREALAPRVEIVVHSAERAPTDDEALALAAAVHAGAIVEAEWSRGGQPRALVRVHPTGRSSWKDREIVFRRSDELSERGRTIGFVIASMLPDPPAAERGASAVTVAGPQVDHDPAGTTSTETGREAGSAPSPKAGSDAGPRAGAAKRQAEADASSSSGSDANRGQASRLAGSGAPGSGAPGSGAPDGAESTEKLAGDPAEESSRNDASRGSFHRSIEGAVVGVLPIGGDGERLGGVLRARFDLSPFFALHFASSVRFGELKPAEASLFTWLGMVGMSWRARPEGEHVLSVGLRVEAGPKYIAATHLSADDQVPDIASRWLPAASAACEASYGFRPSLALVGSMAGEMTLGRTDIFVHRALVATLTPFAVSAEIGIRARF